MGSPSAYFSQKRKVEPLSQAFVDSSLCCYFPTAMGLCLPCLNGSSSDYDQPTPVSVALNNYGIIVTGGIN